MADPQVVRDYVDDLRGLLERSSIIEQRGFLKSFVERIEVGDSQVKMYYTVPMPPSTIPGGGLHDMLDGWHQPPLEWNHYV
jgi:hypothetical protein